MFCGKSMRVSAHSVVYGGFGLQHCKKIETRRGLGETRSLSVNIQLAFPNNSTRANLSQTSPTDRCLRISSLLSVRLKSRWEAPLTQDHGRPAFYAQKICCIGVAAWVTGRSFWRIPSPVSTKEFEAESEMTDCGATRIATMDVAFFGAKHIRSGTGHNCD